MLVSVRVRRLRAWLQDVINTIIMFIIRVTIMEGTLFLKLILMLVSIRGLMTRVEGQHAGIGLLLTQCSQWKMRPN
jgi:hypothetical protein